MKFGELKRLLRKNGCYFLYNGTNHETWYSPMTNRKFSVGRHDSKEVKKGTLEGIKKEAGI